MQSPIYLDNNATTPVDPRVVQAMIPVLTEHFGNPASATHSYGWYAAELVEIAREQVAKLIGAKPSEIIFTSGATESNNLAIIGCTRMLAQGSRPQHHIISAATEHRSVLDTVRELNKDWFAVDLLGVDSTGMIPPQALSQSLRSETGLITIMLANNEIGVVQDLCSLTTVSQQQGILFHTDATQALGKMPVSVDQLGVDLLSLSAHKFYGPKGVGALYLREGSAARRLVPLFLGGGHEFGLRSGTLNVAGIVGLGKACEIAYQELDQVRNKLELLTGLFMEQLTAQVDGVLVNGPTQERLPGNINISVEGIDSSALIGALSSTVALSAGSACTSRSKTPSYVLAALGHDNKRQRSSIRVGVGRFNTEEEMVSAATIIARATKKLRS